MSYVIWLLILQWCSVVVPHWLWNLAWVFFGCHFLFIVLKAIKEASK